MIGSIRGKIILKSDKSVVVETGGVGYKIEVAPYLLSEIAIKENEEVFLFIHTHVREDALSLYGFKDKEDLRFFEMLIGISGIGPKGALNILSIAPVKTLIQAISSGDLAYLTKVSGIGRKTAEKILLELKDKFTDSDMSSSSLRSETDVLEALKALGYSQYEARETLKDIPANLDINSKIKEALKILGNR